MSGMGHGAEGDEARFAAYVEGLVGMIGHAERAGPLRNLLRRTVAAGQAQECGALGGADGAGAQRRLCPGLYPLLSDEQFAGLS